MARPVVRLRRRSGSAPSSSLRVSPAAPCLTLRPLRRLNRVTNPSRGAGSMSLRRRAEVIAAPIRREPLALVVSGKVDDVRPEPFRPHAGQEAHPKRKARKESLRSRDEPTIGVVLGDPGRHMHVKPVVPPVANRFSTQSPDSVSSTSVPRPFIQGAAVGKRGLNAAGHIRRASRRVGCVGGSNGPFGRRFS